MTPQDVEPVRGDAAWLRRLRRLLALPDAPQDGGGVPDHRSYYRAAPLYALLFGGLAFLPVLLHWFTASYPAVSVFASVVAAAGSGLVMFAALRGLGALELEKERRRHDLAEEHQRVVQERQAIERNIEVARQVQASLLPPPHFQPCGRHVRAACWFNPELAVGGDYYDLKMLDDRRLAALLVDVSGHGLSAALVTGLMKMSFELGNPEAVEPAAFMAQLNDVLCRFTPAESFATVVYLVYDIESGDLRYVSAGHSPVPIVLRARGELTVLLDSSNLLAGIERDLAFEEGRERLGPGDCLVLCTDGITEAMDAQRDPWGEERMYDLLAGLAVREAPAVCQALREAVQAFEAGAPQHDDQTIMVLEVLKRAADA